MERIEYHTERIEYGGKWMESAHHLKKYEWRV